MTGQPQDGRDGWDGRLPGGAPERPSALLPLGVVLAALLLGLWGVFLLPFRVAGTLVPVSLLLAVLVGPLCLLSARLLRGRAWAVVPAMVWLGVAVLGLLTGPGGDVLAPVGAIANIGLGALVVGALSAIAGISLYRPATPGATSRRTTTGGARRDRAA